VSQLQCAAAFVVQTVAGELRSWGQARVAAIQKELSANDSASIEDSHYKAEMDRRKKEAAEHQQIIAKIKWVRSGGDSRRIAAPVHPARNTHHTNSRMYSR
jgi:hypothetical protein